MKKALNLVALTIMGTAGLLTLGCLITMGQGFSQDGILETLRDVKGWSIDYGQGLSLINPVLYVIAVIAIATCLALGTVAVIIRITQLTTKKNGVIQIAVFLTGILAIIAATPFVAGVVSFHAEQVRFTGQDLSLGEGLAFGLHYLVLGFIFWTTTKVAEAKIINPTAKTERAITLQPSLLTKIYGFLRSLFGSKGAIIRLQRTEC